MEKQPILDSFIFLLRVCISLKRLEAFPGGVDIPDEGWQFVLKLWRFTLQ
jgi:hypothetical protein